MPTAVKDSPTRKLKIPKMTEYDESFRAKSMMEQLEEACYMANAIEDHITWMLGEEPPYGYYDWPPRKNIEDEPNSHGWLAEEWRFLYHIIEGGRSSANRKRPSGVTAADVTWAKAMHKEIMTDLVEYATKIIKKELNRTKGVPRPRRKSPARRAPI